MRNIAPGLRHARATTRRKQMVRGGTTPSTGTLPGGSRIYPVGGGKQQRQAAAASSSGKQQRQAAAASSSGKQQRQAAAAGSSGRQQRQAAAASSSGRQQRQAAAASSSGRQQRQAAAASSSGSGKRQRYTKLPQQQEQHKQGAKTELPCCGQNIITCNAKGPLPIREVQPTFFQASAVFS